MRLYVYKSVIQILFVKILDKYIVKQFVFPYIISFLIAEFVLVMKFMWINIDDLAGKGFTVIDFLRLLFYFSITVIPMAVPITILISSVLVYGDLSEKYELSSIKSAGISWIRIMRPAILIAILTFAFSITVSNYLKPKSMLKFMMVFTSIKMKKPAMNIQEKIFNTDFEGYSIHVDSKSKDNRSIQGIKIYDLSNKTKNKYNIITAKRGEIYTTENGKYFMMKLYDGYQYLEQNERITKADTNLTFPLRRTSFDVLEKAFDLSDFNKDVAGLFSSKRKDLFNTLQFLEEIDVLNSKIDENKSNIPASISKLLNESNNNYKTDVAFKKHSKSFVESLEPENIEEIIVSTNEIINIEKHKIETKVRRLNSFIEQRDYWTLGLHQQYVLAFICLIFIFIGAPLGSIIRKGGYGLPILVSILFFTIFILLNISGEKLNKSQIFTPVLNAWLPILVLFPISIALTVKALLDNNSLKLYDLRTKLFKILKIKNKYERIDK